MRRYDDPVEVRTGSGADPDQFLWRGRLWQVREVVAHWVETGAWWRHEGPESGDLLREQEVWRVTAAPGRTAWRVGDFGVFDLAFSWVDGGWRLTRAVD
ncbi:DUF6504 family protein [Nocardioides aequoreus]|uniref:DUF6504 family protein n=1 Tax=Nocardioides aequoreus TaxID=397278 RepID=UPI000566C1EA|nr:DUF6504 family protein [Nocardioides aequoreus]